MIQTVTQPAVLPGTAPPTGEVRESRPRAADRFATDDAVELSEAARGTAQQAPIREQLVHSVRSQIAAGTYLTPEKLDVVVDRLHVELTGRP